MAIRATQEFRVIAVTRVSLARLATVGIRDFQARQDILVSVGLPVTQGSAVTLVLVGPAGIRVTRALVGHLVTPVSLARPVTADTRGFQARRVIADIQDSQGRRDIQVSVALAVTVGLPE